MEGCLKRAFERKMLVTTYAWRTVFRMLKNAYKYYKTS